MVIKSHYEFDEVTRIIVFDKNAILYQFEKKILAEHGVDIDAIQTVDEYDRIRQEYHTAFNEAVVSHWQHVTPNTIEEKYRQALMIGNLDNVKRLQPIVLKMKRLNIRIVK